MDREALSELYDAEASNLVLLVTGIVRDRHVAEDIVHDAMLKALAATDVSGPRATTAAAWLRTVAANAARDHLRRARRITVEEPAVLSGWCEAEPVGGQWGASTAIHALLDGLPAAEREAMHARYELGLSVREVASAVSKSVDAVRQLESRALRKLRLALEPAR